MCIAKDLGTAVGSCGFAETLAEVVGWDHDLYEMGKTLTGPSDRLACKCDSRGANAIKGDVKMKDQIKEASPGYLKVTSRCKICA